MAWKNPWPRKWFNSRTILYKSCLFLLPVVRGWLVWMYKVLYVILHVISFVLIGYLPYQENKFSTQWAIKVVLRHSRLWGFSWFLSRRPVWPFLIFLFIFEYWNGVENEITEFPSYSYIFKYRHASVFETGSCWCWNVWYWISVLLKYSTRSCFSKP